MNDALRLLRKFLRSCGYDIKEHYRYKLLPVARLQEHDQLDKLYRAADRPVGHEDRKRFDELVVCLRTCLREDNLKAATTRVTGSDHKEVVYRCLNSLIRTINHAVRERKDVTISFVIFDDHSDVAQKQILKNLQAKARCNVEFVTIKETGQGASLYETFRFARDKGALFYFCEDDYLHEETALYEMVQFYQHVHDTFATHLVLHPQEHEFLYIKSLYPSYLLRGERRHWRTISHATHVLFLHSDLVSRYWKYFSNTRHVGNRRKRRLGAESNTTNHLFQHVPGFAPVPALAAHLQSEGSLPPFFDWRPLWEKNRLE